MSVDWQWFWVLFSLYFSRRRNWEAFERAEAREKNLQTRNASRRKAAADVTDKVSATTSPHFFALLFYLFILSVISHAACVTVHLSLVRMLHFLPALLTLWENQYLLVPAGRTNSLWNSVFLRQTIPGGCDTAASCQAVGCGDGSGILVDHCTLIEARIRHFMELDAGRGY